MDFYVLGLALENGSRGMGFNIEMTGLKKFIFSEKNLRSSYYIELWIPEKRKLTSKICIEL